jgi:prolyl oligopeptidase
MQHDQGGSAPILLFVETKAGHGGGKPLEKALNEAADQYAFLLANLHFNPKI